MFKSKFIEEIASYGVIIILLIGLFSMGDAMAGNGYCDNNQDRTRCYNNINTGMNMATNKKVNAIMATEHIDQETKNQVWGWYDRQVNIINSECNNVVCTYNSLEDLRGKIYMWAKENNVK